MTMCRPSESWPWTAEETRARMDPDDMRRIARYVHERKCQCCGAFGEGWGEQMECGHWRCGLCVDHDHPCFACILAT